jgi:hypothetical protein
MYRVVENVLKYSGDNYGARHCYTVDTRHAGESTTACYDASFKTNMTSLISVLSEILSYINCYLEYNLLHCDRYKNSELIESEINSLKIYRMITNDVSDEINLL